jgi:hypothetical protein
VSIPVFVFWSDSRPASQFGSRELRRRTLAVESHGRYRGGAAVARSWRVRPLIIMSKIVEWQGSVLDVQARSLPLSLWIMTSIDVFMDGQCILSTGWRMAFTGSQAATFTHSNSAHKAALSWGMCDLSFSIPFQLEIDGIPVAGSRVRVRNWQLSVIVQALITAAFMALMYSMRHTPTSALEPTATAPTVSTNR